VATTLHDAYEIRNATEYFDDIPDVKLPGEIDPNSPSAFLKPKPGIFV
jgi:non-homologous end joining protein Ku